MKQFTSKNQKIHAFCLDILGLAYAAKLPEQFSECDVFYADPPWQQGFAEFNKRVGMGKGREYSTFLTVLRHVAWLANPRPFIYVTGKHALPILVPDWSFDTTLNGAKAVAACWGFHPPYPFPTEIDLLEYLAKHYGRVGDMMCGFGRTGIIFAQAGKSAVLSDYNPQCIGYISRNADLW